MIQFMSDYCEGAHPNIIRRLEVTNFEQFDGYGEDRICREAQELILAACGRKPGEDLEVHFVVGGTQANKLVIKSALRPYEGVICCTTGHLNGHEAGAIEDTGHKLLTYVSPDGKVKPEMIDDCAKRSLLAWDRDHLVLPGLVYVSNSTELGTVYTRAELLALREACDKYGLLLFLDGARLGCAMASEVCDYDFRFLADVCDAYYIGGTKNGALIGEAIVLRNDIFKPGFKNLTKQTIGKLAKGWLLGIQFSELFQNDLYMENARHANAMSKKMRDGMAAMGVRFLVDGPTNMQYPILPNDVLDKLGKDYGFSLNGVEGETESCIRVVCSWATPEASVDAFLKSLEALL